MGFTEFPVPDRPIYKSSERLKYEV